MGLMSVKHGPGARMAEAQRATVRGYVRLALSAEEAAASLRRMYDAFERDFGSWRLKQARKRTPRYIAKGGVRK